MLGLRNEGFEEVYMCDDVPGKIYDAHQHPYRSVHLVLQGSMRITMNGNSHQVSLGERSDVPQNTMHSVVIGDEGCMYIVAEK